MQLGSLLHQQQAMRRRASAILAADVVDYSRLMAEDEVDTHDRVKACLIDFVEPTILQYGGRIVRLIGDGVLVEFAEVAPAVACAVAVQRGTAARDARVTRGRRIRFRIGVNYGDVIVDGDGIYGNGVNVAVRLEALADPGGVFISGAAREQIPAAAGHRYASLGERLLKNIAEPVAIYRVVLDRYQAAADDWSVPPPAAPVATPLPTCPYRGLFAFREEDASYFFGRQNTVGELQAAVDSRSLVAVLGASGSGKSSVVLAGLVPRLRAAGGWLIAGFRPDRTPLRNLLAALLPLRNGVEREESLHHELDAWQARLADGRATLGELIDQILAANDGARLLLIADQFEQLYTLVEDPDERERFLGSVLDLTEAARSPAAPRATVILTLRADFLGRVLTSRRLADALKGADVKLGPMTEDELRAAIENPARQEGVRFEMGLVDRILMDVRGQTGSLPLLEFALTELWARQRHGRLTHVGYEEIGGVAEAIAGYAEEVYRALAPPEQERVREVFLQLVRPGEGTEDTGRVASRAEIRDERWAAVDRLADARLIVTRRDEGSGQDTAEVVHEALIREWQRLRRWVDGDREFLVWRQRLAEARKEWQAGGRAEGYLLRAAPLAVALDWLARRGAELADDDRVFIEASRARLQREQAERERGRRRLVGGLAAAAAVFFLVAAGAGYFWYDAQQQKEIVDRERDRSESLRVSAQRTESLFLTDVAAERLQSGDIEDAMLLALEALPEDLDAPERPYVPEAEAALYRAVNVYRGTTVLGRHDSAVWHGALSSTGERLVTGADDGEVRLWRLTADGQPASFEVLGRHHGPVLHARFLPDDRRVLTTSADRTARLWPIDGSAARVLAGHDDAVVAGAFSPQSGAVATASWDGTARLWNGSTGQSIATLRGHAASVVDVAFSPDGQRLVTASTDGTARLWDAHDGRPLGEPLAGHQGAVWRALFSPDGAFVLTASADGTVRLWEAATGAARGEPLIGHEAGVLDADFSAAPRAGRWVAATASHDGTARLWEPERGRLLAVMKGHQGPVVKVSFSADGETIVTVSRDGTVKLWDAQTGEQITHTRRHGSAALWAAFSPDGRRLVSGSEDGVVKLWDSRPGQEAMVLHSAGGPIGDVAFSPDQRLIVTTAEEKTIPGAVQQGDYMPRLWDAATGAEVALLRGHTGDVYRAGFSPDGRLLVTAGAAQAFLWDLGALDRTKPLPAVTVLTPSAALPGHQGIVFHAEFDPGGQRVVTASADGVARLWALEQGAVPGPPQVLAHAGQVRLATFSPDGRHLLTTTDDTTARLWDVASGAQIGKDLPHNAVVTHASFGATAWDPAHPLRIATAARDGEVRLWDGATGAPLQTLAAHAGFVTRALFSPDGRRLLSASMDHAARIWDTASGDPLVLLHGHTKGIYAAAFAPDGRRVATASYWDRTVRLWDTASGAPLAVFVGHSSGIKQIAFRPDGRQLVSASLDGTARLWDVLPQGAELMRLARGIVAAEHLDLDAEQRRQLLSLHADGQPSRH